MRKTFVRTKFSKTKNLLMATLSAPESSDLKILCEEVYDIFKKIHTDKIMKKDQLSTAIRAVGFFLTYSEGDKLTNKQSSNDISKENFVEICLKLDNKYSPYDVLMSAFQSFDPNSTGKISEAELRIILKDYHSEFLDNESIEQFINLFTFDSSGSIEYSKICEHLLR